MTDLPVIAVDIGNSAVKVALQHAPSEIWRFDLRATDWAPRLVETMRREVRGRAEIHPGSDPDQAAQWVTASVNRPALRQLHQTLRDAFPADRWRELTRPDVDLETDLRNPASVGIDRLLGAYAAVRLLGLSDGISIDAGSAVTIDLIRQQRFVGGAILPGARLQLAGLSQGTDCLPAVVGNSAQALEVPGRDTEAAMRAGVWLGIAGAIERLLEEYAVPSEPPPVVLLTGGDADPLAPLIRRPVRRVDDLVLSAILRIAQPLRIE